MVSTSAAAALCLACILATTLVAVTASSPNKNGFLAAMSATSNDPTTTNQLYPFRIDVTVAQLHQLNPQYVDVNVVATPYGGGYNIQTKQLQFVGAVTLQQGAKFSGLVTVTLDEFTAQYTSLSPVQYQNGTTATNLLGVRTWNATNTLYGIAARATGVAGTSATVCVVNVTNPNNGTCEFVASTPVNTDYLVGNMAITSEGQLYVIVKGDTAGTRALVVIDLASGATRSSLALDDKVDYRTLAFDGGVTKASGIFSFRYVAATGQTEMWRVHPTNLNLWKRMQHWDSEITTADCGDEYCHLTARAKSGVVHSYMVWTVDGTWWDATIKSTAAPTLLAWVAYTR